MKRKLDFITNSSSSSFLVAWPNKIEKMEDVLKIIPEQEKASIVFHDAIEQTPYHLEHGNFDYDFDIATQAITEDFVQFILSGYTTNIDSYHLVEPIRNKIRREKIIQQDIRLFENNGLTNDLTVDDWATINEEANKQFKEQYGMTPDELNRKKALTLIKSFMEQNKGKYIYKFHYGDEDGNLYSDLEHDGVFESLSTIQVSHH
jgi:hypothetical protein